MWKIVPKLTWIKININQIEMSFIDLKIGIYEELTLKNVVYGRYYIAPRRTRLLKRGLREKRKKLRR